MRDQALRLGTAASELGLIGYGAQERMLIHNEGIYAPEPLRYFLLACVQRADYGGETLLFDSRVAAELIRAQAPELLSVKIHYNTPHYGTSATHDLVNREDGEYRLRFREANKYDKIVAMPRSWTIDEFYTYMSQILMSAHVASVEWRAGDILIVDNARMLHSRGPYKGTRKMIRMRVDDPLNT